MQEIQPDGRYTYIYTDPDSNEPLAQVRNWTNNEGESKQEIHYFHCDQIGIPREMTDDEKIGVKINSKYPSRGKIMDQYVLLLIGALKMSQQLTKNPQYNDLTVGYYLGMTFPKYNHPAKLYDEINLDKVDNIRKSKETISYYIGFYKDGKLIKFEKYINANKVMDFAYEYDEMGNLIKIYKNNIEAGKPIQKRM